MAEYVLDEGIETFEIKVKNRKTPIIIKFCPTDEHLMERYRTFFKNISEATKAVGNIEADVYGNGKTANDQELLDKYKEICIKEIDKLLDYEGNGEALFARCNPFRLTRSGVWLEQIFYVISDIIGKDAPEIMNECKLNLSARGEQYAKKYLK